MSTPSRPAFRANGRRPRNTRSVGSDINQALLTVLSIIPQVAQLASNGGAQNAVRANVPASAAPEKCRLQMTAGEHRAWKILLSGG